MPEVEFALFQEMAESPRLLIEQISDSNGDLFFLIRCVITQVVYILVKAVLCIRKIEGSCMPINCIQLHATPLQFS